MEREGREADGPSRSPSECARFPGRSVGEARGSTGARTCWICRFLAGWSYAGEGRGLPGNGYIDGRVDFFNRRGGKRERAGSLCPVHVRQRGTDRHRGEREGIKDEKKSTG